jgi:hypothetical protein
MTKVQKRFQLQGVLDDVLIRKIADAHSIYGIEKIMLSPSRDGITVEFDASRMRVAEVESALQRAGVSVSAPLN